MRQQATLGVGDVCFGGCSTAADIECTAFAADRACILGHALEEADLEFERSVAGSRWQHGVNREPHH